MYRGELARWEEEETESEIQQLKDEIAEHNRVDEKNRLFYLATENKHDDLVEEKKKWKEKEENLQRKLTELAGRATITEYFRTGKRCWLGL